LKLSPERIAARLDRFLTGRVQVSSPAGAPMRSLVSVGDRPLEQGLVLLLCRLLLRAFFRRIEVEGLEHVPASGGGIVVAWHPNGLIDPALILGSLPRPLVFGARSGLFRWPGLGWVLRAAGAVPIHRSVDRTHLSPEDRRASNQRSLEALAQAIANGGLSCLFPEGDSHDAPHLLSLKTGIARLYYLAREAGAAPFILPVGLHYDAKEQFRSHALVRIHPPLRLPADLAATPPTDDAAFRDHCQRFVAHVAHALGEVVGVTESWELHHRMATASRLLRAERARRAGADLDRASMLENQVGFWRIWEGISRWRRRDPDRVERLLEDIGAYRMDLRALNLDDEDLDHAPLADRPARMLLLLAQTVGVFLVAPSLIALGGLVNLGPFVVLRIGTNLAAKRHKDVATLKLLGGAVLYPVTWVCAAGIAARIAFELHAARAMIPETPLLAALAVLLLSFLGGMLALRYLRLVRETAHALRVRITRLHRRRAIRRLLVERSRLADGLEALEEGMDLPGAVTAEGAVLATEVVPPGGRA